MESGNLDDIERATSVCKLAAEAEKDSVEAATQGPVVRQEGLRNWAQLLVPLLCVLTLAVTITIQTFQQRQQERSRQDTVWRGTPTQRNVSMGGVPVLFTYVDSGRVCPALM